VDHVGVPGESKAAVMRKASMLAAVNEDGSAKPKNVSFASTVTMVKITRYDHHLKNEIITDAGGEAIV
jgi:hypothetical protein